MMAFLRALRNIGTQSLETLRSKVGFVCSGDFFECSFGLNQKNQKFKSGNPQLKMYSLF
ncbi:hypothetical protein SDC9_01141 [bioreactor metagenome]|uniref:Uncharacterized protein n=1 Tax=bioreactor metagenome TaxID=1076179 RepID=A0A644SPW6_9ZZZZ